MTTCECGDPQEAHTATCFSPIYSSTACQYAHDSDNPCWCYKFKPLKGHLLKPDGTVMNISMGKLTDEQEAVVRTFVHGYNVHDIGAGQLGLAKKLTELGALTITAIDKDYSRNLVWAPGLLVTLVGETFAEYARHGHVIDVAFVSWPEVYAQQGIVQLLRDARTVIYLGSNFDGAACGSKEMFEQLVTREVLATVPHRWNTLIVYGQKRVVRSPLGEEFAALHRGNGPPYSFTRYGDPREELP